MFFKLDHRYNKKKADIIPIDCVEQTRTTISIKIQSSTTEINATDNDKKRQAPSFHCQINNIPNQRQKLQEQNYYEQIEITLEDQLKQDNSSEELDDEFERIYMDELERSKKQNDIQYKEFEKSKSC
ncbi:unnamed protein product [Adineta steineri]|uniref:Uncharacterized protein n=1 Tax=Adineta steineri TaxID=433720 RepID=A0A816A1N8_9BILA|nr:unnamed protein product [Adineta steineri]CAF1592214.1 unnamed protein product [Adineta steineri]